VRRFPIEGGLLLLDGAANCLYAYNDTARHVWELIAAGRGEPDLIAEFADHWGIPQTVARTDTEAMVAEWRSQNVLVERGARRRAPAKMLPCPAFRLGGQKSPWLVSAADLAELIDARREKAAVQVPRWPDAQEGAARSGPRAL